MTTLPEWQLLPNSAKESAKRAAANCTDFLSDLDAADVSLLAILVNHFNASADISLELWVRLVSSVKEATSEGIPENSAMWLYEHWSPNDLATQILHEDFCSETGIEGYFSVACEVAHQIRASHSRFRNHLIVVDDNHEYDGFVMQAVAKANPDGQARDWLLAPPPDCVPSNLNHHLLDS